jgi:hypothetical protein
MECLSLEKFIHTIGKPRQYNEVNVQNLYNWSTNVWQIYMVHCFIINSYIRSHFEVRLVIYDTNVLQLKAPRHRVCHVYVTTLPAPCRIFITTVMWISGTQKEALNRSLIAFSIVRFWKIRSVSPKRTLCFGNLIRFRRSRKLKAIHPHCSFGNTCTIHSAVLKF